MLILRPAPAPLRSGLAICFAIVYFAQFTTSLVAQNPFEDAPDDAPGLFAPAPAADTVPTDGAVVEQENPLVTQLLEHSRRGNVQLAEAISSLARIGRWQLVDQLLIELAKKKLDQPQLAALAKQIESSVFLKINRQPAVSAPAKQALATLAEAATAEAESPARLQRAIAQLGSSSVDERLSGARALLGGGNAAIAEIVAAVVVDKPVAPRDDLLRVMLKLGDGGKHALQQLALYGQPNVRTQALAALGRIDRDAFVSEFVTGLHAADASESERAVAVEQLSGQQLGTPSRPSAMTYLRGEFERKLDRARLQDNDYQTTMLWSVNDARNGVTYQSVLAIAAAYREVSDAASRLRRIGDLTADDALAVLSADVAYRVLIDPDWGDAEQVDVVLKSHAVSSGMISDALARSLAQSDYLATVGLLRLIKPEASVVQQNLLLSAGSRPSPLVQAATSSVPLVRYEAAIAASRLANGVGYSGSSYVKGTLSEMARLGDRPTAVLVETRPELSVRLENILGDLGYDVTVVGNVSQLQRCIAMGGDLRLIVSKTELSDLPAIEMLDLVRRVDRGRDVPIVFYGAEVDGLAEKRWQAPAEFSPLPPLSATFFDDLQRRLELQSRLLPLSVIDRQRYRSAALELLK